MMSEGILDFATRVKDPFTHWTKTVWVDEPSMKKFRNSGGHQLPMRILARICSEASYTRWQQETPEAPTWEEAHRVMLKSGKQSKLKNPSSSHLAGQAPSIY